MNVEEFKSVLERLESLYAASGDNARMKDLHKVATLFDGYENCTVEEFVADTAALLAQTKAAPKAVSAVNQEAVDKHVRAFLDAGLDWGKYDLALAAAEADKRLKKSEWEAIANSVMSIPAGETYDLKYKTIKAAKEKIRMLMVRRVDSAGKHETIRKMSQWAS